MVGNDEQNDIVGARTAGIDGADRTDILPQMIRNVELCGALVYRAYYEGLLDYVLANA